MKIETNPKKGRGRPRKSTQIITHPSCMNPDCHKIDRAGACGMCSGFMNKTTPEKPSKTRDELELLKERVELMEFTLIGLATAVEFGETEGVLSEVRRLLKID